MKYEEWLNVWYENFVKPSAKLKTIERYGEIIKNRLVPEFGARDINDVSPLALQKYVSELTAAGNFRTGRGLAASTVNGILTVIRTSLKTAHDLGLTAEYTAYKVKRPKISEKKVECFSLCEQKLIENSVLKSKRSRLLGIVVCLYTGLRIGELLALSWKDVKLEEKVIIISKTCHYGKYGRVVETPKTAGSCREIPVSSEVIKILKRMKTGDSEYVVSARGKPVSVRTYQKSFEAIQEKLKIKKRGFHALRHTFATRALECGMDVKTLSEILGHKNSAITLNRYAHSLFEHKAAMMNKLGSSLLKNKVPQI